MVMVKCQPQKCPAPEIFNFFITVTKSYQLNPSGTGLATKQAQSAGMFTV